MSRSFPTLAAALLALGALCAGIGVYLLDRGGGADFVPDLVAQALGTRPFFGVWSGSLPTFVHVFAFSLLSAIALGLRPTSAVPVCVTWGAIDGLFELGQLDVAKDALRASIPESLADFWLLDRTVSYFTLGTFDGMDVASIVLGAAAAYIVIRSLASEESDHARV